MRGVRARLTVTIVALVVLTAGVLGVGVVRLRRHRAPRPAQGRRASAGRFDLTVADPDRPSPSRRGGIRSRAASSRPSERRSTGVVDLGRQRLSGTSSVDFTRRPDARLRGRRRVAARSPSQWTTPRRAAPKLVVGGRLPDATARRSTSSTTSAASRRRSACSGSRSAAAPLLLALLALLAARVDRPRRARPGRGGVTGRGADRARRLLGARAGEPRATSSGRGRSGSTGWRRRSRRRSGGSEAAQAQNRRFVADVVPRAADAARRRSSPRRRSCATISTRCRSGSRRAGELLVGRHRPAANRSSTTSWRSRGSTPRPSRSASEPVDLGRAAPSAVAARRLPDAPPSSCRPGADRAGDGPAPARADRRQPPRQRPRARPRRAGRGRASARPTTAIAIAVEDRGPGRADPSRLEPDLRSLLQGRSLAPRRQQRARSRDRRRARGAARRRAPRVEPRRRRAADRAAACL